MMISEHSDNTLRIEISDITATNAAVIVMAVNVALNSLELAKDEKVPSFKFGYGNSIPKQTSAYRDSTEIEDADEAPAPSAAFQSYMRRAPSTIETKKG